MIFQSSLSNLILMAHDSPLHLLHRSAKWKGSSKMAAWIAGIPIPWHPCNTPRGSPYRLRAPLKFFKTTGASPCHVLGWVALVHTISYHTPKKTIVLEFHCTCFIRIHLQYLKFHHPNSWFLSLLPVHCRNHPPLAAHPLLLCMSLDHHCLQTFAA